MTWPPAGHDRQRELFSDDAEPCEPPRETDSSVVEIGDTVTLPNGEAGTVEGFTDGFDRVAVVYIGLGEAMREVTVDRLDVVDDE